MGTEKETASSRFNYTLIYCIYTRKISSTNPSIVLPLPYTYVHFVVDRNRITTLLFIMAIIIYCMLVIVIPYFYYFFPTESIIIVMTNFEPIKFNFPSEYYKSLFVFLRQLLLPFHQN